MRNKHKAAVLAVAIALAPGHPSPVSAQTPESGTIRGRVIDQSGQAVSGARVVLDLIGTTDSRYETTTDEAGVYRQTGLASGQYTVVAERDELGGDAFRVSVRPGRTVQVNFELEPGRRVATWVVELEGREMLTRLFADGVAASRAGDYAVAVVKFRDALELMPTCVDCYFNAGVAHGRLGDYPSAEAAFKSALDIKPDYAAAYYGLADIYMRQQRPDDAASARGAANRIALEAIAAGRARAAEALDEGVVFFEGGNLLDARRRFEEALRQDPNLSDARYWLGMTHAQDGRPEAAVREFQIYLQVAAEGTFAAQAREALEKLNR